MAMLLFLVQFLTPDFKFALAISYLTTNFGGTVPLRFMHVLSKKNGFSNAKFLNFALIGGYKKLVKTPKGTPLADFTHFEPLIMQIRSRVFSRWDNKIKRRTTNSQRGHLFVGNSPPTKFY